MSHMVIYRGTDGKPGYHQTDDIHDAVGFVEELRNTEGVDHARIFRLEEVTFEYKPYYRVELGTATTAIGSAAADTSTEDAEEAMDADVADDEADDAEDAEDVDDLEEVTEDVDEAEMSDDDTDDESSNGDESVSAGTARRGLFGR